MTGFQQENVTDAGERDQLMLVHVLWVPRQTMANTN